MCCHEQQQPAVQDVVKLPLWCSFHHRFAIRVEMELEDGLGADWEAFAGEAKIELQIHGPR